MKILGIETSCDETAVAIVDDARTIHANLVLSQLEEHRAFGGVVPEIAARAHADHLHSLIRAALEDSGLALEDMDGFAATCGPGLIGGVMIGMVAAKALAAAGDKPFLAVNHLEGHALTARLSDNVRFPFLLLLVSGGHTQILVAENVGQYKPWGTTIDDAAGECFDKAARLMGLPYPGGPALQALAAECDEHEAALGRFPLPRPLVDKHKNDLEAMDFSFSGLKTAVRTHIDAMPEGILKRSVMAQLAFAFEVAMAEIITARCEKALRRFAEAYPQEAKPRVVIAGGVAANTRIRAALVDLCEDRGAAMINPPLNLCTDNAAMIAWAGLEHLREGRQDDLDFKAKARWGL